MNYHQDGKDGGNQGGKIGGEQGVDLENRKTLIIEAIKEDSEISTVSIEFVAGKGRRGSTIPYRQMTLTN